MSEDKFDIVFKGELVRSFELPVVKKNISQLFKVQGPKLEALFTGKTIVLKKNLDFETATKYRVAIKKAGARVDLRPVDVEEKKAAPVAEATPAQPKPNFGERSSALSQPAAEPQALPESTVSQSASNEPASSDSGITIAPVGTDVLAPSERKEFVAANIDVSDLSVKEGGDLLEASEKREYDRLDVDLGDYDLAPPGEDVLKESERKKVQAVNVDISALSMGEPGERLSKPSPPPPPAPDVSALSLKEQ